MSLAGVANREHRPLPQYKLFKHYTTQSFKCAFIIFANQIPHQDYAINQSGPIEVGPSYTVIYFSP